MKLMVTTPSGVKINLWKPKADQIRFQDILEQMAGVRLYTHNHDSETAYTVLHRALNVLRYMEAMGCDRSDRWALVGQFFAPSYGHLLGNDAYSYEITPTSCGKLLPLYRAVCSKYNVPRYVPHREFTYCDNIISWELFNFLPKFQDQTLYEYSRSYTRNFDPLEPLDKVKAEFYDAAQVLLRRYAPQASLDD